MKYEIEVTDTFGGEANYCWVHRAEIEVDDDIGDMIVLRPVGVLQVIFITPCY